jgi:hypothetical protein
LCLARKYVLTIATGVAFAIPNPPNAELGVATPKTPKAELGEIRIVRNWGPKMDNTDKVPSVISYSPATDEGEKQWGANLSLDAVAMVNSKLELDVQDNKSDELDLILQVLDGMHDLNFEYVKESKGYPDYTWKAPETIVTDYLTKVFQCMEKAISDIGSEMNTRLPVDIVLTVPVVSSVLLSFIRTILNAMEELVIQSERFHTPSSSKIRVQ